MQFAKFLCQERVLFFGWAQFSGKIHFSLNTLFSA